MATFSEKMVQYGKVIAAFGVLAGAITAVFGFGFPSIATSNDVNFVHLRLAQNESRDYEREIKMLKSERLQLRQYKYQIEQSGQPVSPDIIESESDLSDQIDSFKNKKKESEDEIKQRQQG